MTNKQWVQTIQGNLLGVTAIDGLPMVSSRREDGLGFVYIVESNHGVKIGSTINPRRRISQLQKSSGLDFTRIALSQQCSNFTQLEHQLHKIFHDSRKIGEWFNADFTTCCSAMSHLDFKVKPLNSKLSQDTVDKIMSFLFSDITENGLNPDQQCFANAMEGMCGQGYCPLYSKVQCENPECLEG